MRLFIIIILALVLIGVSTQIYFILKERSQLKADLDNLNNRLQALSKENSELNSEIEYFSVPENLEKELKARRNYRKPDEKMIIIVP